MPPRSDSLRILVVGGPTAVGKTACAVRLAERLSGEIVNADSMQVYRRMDAGTAKPTADERARAVFHVVDVVDPDYPFNAGDFVRLADEAIADIAARGRVPIVCGGTGMYVRALVRGLIEAPPVDRGRREELYAVEAERGAGALHAMLAEIDPDKAASIPPADLLRIVRALEVYEQTGETMSALHERHAASPPRYDAFTACLTMDRERLYARIDDRVDRMVAAGLVGEVRGLLTGGAARESNAMQGLGYRQLAAHLAGECSEGEAIERIKRDTRRFAKRQYTWFRNQPGVRWYDSESGVDKLLAESAVFLNATGDSGKT